MGTVSVRMPDEEIEKLEKMAERAGKTRSALLRELAEEKIDERPLETLEDLAGVLSDEKADEMMEAIKESRESFEKSFEDRKEELFDQ